MIFHKFFGRLFYIKILISGRLNITQNMNDTLVTWHRNTNSEKDNRKCNQKDFSKTKWKKLKVL